jgi:hypothetical protein
MQPKEDLDYKNIIDMSEYENRRYLIIPTTIVDEINFNEVMETSIETLRLSIDETKTFVKYNVIVVDEPYEQTYIDAQTGQPVTVTVEPGVYGRPSIYSPEYPELNHEEMLVLLSTEEWSKPFNQNMEE